MLLPLQLNSTCKPCIIMVIECCQQRLTVLPSLQKEPRRPVSKRTRERCSPARRERLSAKVLSYRPTTGARLSIGSRRSDSVAFCELQAWRDSRRALFALSSTWTDRGRSAAMPLTNACCKCVFIVAILSIVVIVGGQGQDSQQATEGAGNTTLPTCQALQSLGFKSNLPIVVIQLVNTSQVAGASAAQLQLLAKGPHLPGLLTTCGSPGTSGC